MITLFSCEQFFKFVSFLLYPTEVTMLKCAMLGAFTVIEVNRLDPDQQKQPCLGPSFVQINLNKICLNHWIVVIAHPTDYIKKWRH